MYLGIHSKRQPDLIQREHKRYPTRTPRRVSKSLPDPTQSRILGAGSRVKLGDFLLYSRLPTYFDASYSLLQLQYIYVILHYTVFTQYYSVNLPQKRRLRATEELYGYWQRTEYAQRLYSPTSLGK